MVLGGLLGAGLTGVLVAAFLAGVLGTGWLLAANAAIGLRTGLFGSASNAALPAVVDKRRLGAALSANQGRDVMATQAVSPPWASGSSAKCRASGSSSRLSSSLPARAARICRPARGSSTRRQLTSDSGSTAMTVSAAGSWAASLRPSRSTCWPSAVST